MKTNSSFFALNPDLVLEATEEAGWHPTGEFTQLNSYENRVFDIRLENKDLPRVIAKFYRPGRWTMEAIQEEHDFLSELEREGIPAVAPLAQKNSTTISMADDMFVAFFPKIYGRMPEEFLGDDLKSVGRLLARIHNVGARKKFKHRAIINKTPFTGWDCLNVLSEWVRPEVWPRYREAASHLIGHLEDNLNPRGFLRIHGDCHRGNLLFNRQFFFVDFDDSMMGPAVQDFWMLFQEQTDEERDLILSGYEELRDFSPVEWELVPYLRALRIISYSAWIARRWSDPSFPRLFPNFESYTFWAEETEALEKVLRS